MSVYPRVYSILEKIIMFISESLFYISFMLTIYQRYQDYIELVVFVGMISIIYLIKYMDFTLFIFMLPVSLSLIYCNLVNQNSELIKYLSIIMGIYIVIDWTLRRQRL